MKQLTKAELKERLLREETVAKDRVVKMMTIQEHIEAFDQWTKDGTISAEYLSKVLGDQTVSVSPHEAEPIRILTQDMIKHMDCPLPPEEGY